MLFSVKLIMMECRNNINYENLKKDLNENKQPAREKQYNFLE
jgi:hypothetical protein